MGTIAKTPVDTGMKMSVNVQLIMCEHVSFQQVNDVSLLFHPIYDTC